MPRQPIHCDAVQVGTVNGRGKLRGAVEVRNGRVVVRIDSESDHEMWAEIDLDLHTLLMLDAVAADVEDVVVFPDDPRDGDTLLPY